MTQATVDTSEPFELREHHESILALLRLKPRTSLELSAVCVSYGSRVSELRRAGYDIRAKRVAGRLFEYELFLKPGVTSGDQGDAATTKADDASATVGSVSPSDTGRTIEGGRNGAPVPAGRCHQNDALSGDADTGREETTTAADDRGRALVAELRLGRWEEALADVGEVDALITDGPYSERTHEGHDDGAQVANLSTKVGGHRKKSDGCLNTYKPRRTLQYAHWTSADVDALVDSWAPRNRGWFVCMSDHSLCGAYEAAYRRHGLTTFAPVGILIPGMTVRLSGDGPSSWMLYANVARPKKLSKWGTLPGGYTGPPGERVHIGGKALWLMRAIVSDYSRHGDLVCDPCAGAASTLVAAIQEGRRAIGAEVDPETHAIGAQRVADATSQPFLFSPVPSPMVQESLFRDGQ